ncbi:Hypothetical predicted protein [Prunus dulcis]|uniref:Uncharacterized protein n=1 Tax=Prunus dulcis TaxID=3755 RepID=A0A5E4FLF8_PRUDU|nr:Hypothetical predicted protein [Prunus dulcis]
MLSLATRLQEIKNWCTMILSVKEIINSLRGFGGFFCSGYASIYAMEAFGETVGGNRQQQSFKVCAPITWRDHML